MKIVKNCEAKGVTKRGQAVAERARQAKMDGQQVKRWSYLDYVTEYGKKLGQVS